MNPRIRKVRAVLKQKGLDGLLVAKEANIAYFTDLTLTDSCLFLTRNKNIVITDFRYLIEAKKLEGFSVQKINGTFSASLALVVKKARVRRLGFEGDFLAYRAFKRIRRSLTGLKLVEATGLVEELRALKEKSELVRIRHAIQISKETFAYARDVMKAGMSEIELARRIDVFARQKGADTMAFPTIVASGPRAARPHAVSDARKIKRGEPVMIDLGVRVKGYNSDLTRTFLMGKIDAKFCNIYNIVLKAQRLAISHIRPGRTASELDMKARNYIRGSGFGQCFGHALGHGVGREVHELPRISRTTKTRLAPGMVFTVEPGIYIPGWGGVRIEDMALVTKTGCRVLTDDIDKAI